MGSRFDRILLPVDNSRYSNISAELAMSLARAFGSQVVGFHVYAAGLHRGRFDQLEVSLPSKYQEPGVLGRQRLVHASLISHGLELISRSYLDSYALRFRERDVVFEEKVAEGKNWFEIVKEAGQGYGLVIMGARGLGEQGDDAVGSVCRRVVRRLVGPDILVVREDTGLDGPIVVGLDGSPSSWRGCELALSLAKAFGSEVEAVAAYDSDLHARVFTNLVGVLSPEAGRLFHLQEQERLHQDVIDRGMANLCQEHLNKAQALAEVEKVAFRGRILKGKAATEIASYARECRPSLVVFGRFGAHQIEDMDLGGTAETLLLSLPFNTLLASKQG